MNYDVAIVGAGPSGLILAQNVACKGYKVILFEEHSKVGSPQHCTGKISTKALRELQLEAVGVLQRIKGATFYSPNYKSITIKQDETRAFILDRESFEQNLLKKALKEGAHLLTSSKVKNVIQTPRNVIIFYEENGKKRKISSKLVVGADGATSFTARVTGLYTKKVSELLIGVQREVEVSHNIKDVVELYFGTKWAPGFFAWLVPISNDKVRVGLAVPLKSPNSPFKYLDNFIKKHPIALKKLDRCNTLSQVAHIIPIGGPLIQTVSNGILIVGDAAGQVKSTTGGGLYYGMVCAIIASKTIIKALPDCSGILTKEKLINYEKAWRKRFGNEVAFTVKARAFLNSLKDEEFSYLFDIIRRDETLIKKLQFIGDIDRQSTTIRLLLFNARYLIKKPKILYKLLKHFPTFF